MTSAPRLDRARRRMREVGVDVLAVSAGPDLVYLTGYEAMPLERLTMLVLARDGDAVLLVPRLEVPRVDEDTPGFTVEAWDETDDPIERIAKHAGGARVLALGDHVFARDVLALQGSLPDARFVLASHVTSPLRIVKDEAELGALRDAATAVDEIAQDMRGWSFRGRTERAIHRQLIEQILDRGHERANFAIVATGPNAASPHHEPGDRRIEAGDVVLCDFGGTMHGYCSDITRMYAVGDPRAEVRDAYDALLVAQEAAVRAATVGTRCSDVDAVARDSLHDAGLAARFVHRTGHGIGLEAHEDPYLVEGNDRPLEAGHAFSIEPGVYLPGRFGLRLEDIVIATPAGPQRLNHAPRDLAVVD